jgi:hypothetical protein
MGKPWALIVVLSGSLILRPARAGHEFPIYPSYYPQEIWIESVNPGAAPRLLLDGSIHAYVGDIPEPWAPKPESISFVESLGSYLRVVVNPASAFAKARGRSCAIARSVVQALAREVGDFVFHPYPITPFDADYLYHFDRVEEAMSRYPGEAGGPADSDTGNLRVHAQGRLAQRLVPLHWQYGGADWDVAVEEVDARALIAAHSSEVGGRAGPPWIKEGWFHAYLLLQDGLVSPAAKQGATSVLERLESGDYRGPEQEANLERQLISLLTSECRELVAGYSVRKEYFNSEFSAGIENIAFDSQLGLDSPIFIRTVKLKDFPWNGWLRIGVEGQPLAAWNPIAGFTDEAGRLIWSALGDPALLPEPYAASWSLNRISDVRSSADQ